MVTLSQRPNTAVRQQGNSRTSLKGKAPKPQQELISNPSEFGDELMNLNDLRLVCAMTLATVLLTTAAPGQPVRPWMNTALPPDERAALLQKEMTQDEQLALVHGVFALPIFGKMPEGA